MQTKRFLFTVLFFMLFFCYFGHTEDIIDLNGSWIPTWLYNNINGNFSNIKRKSTHIYSWGNAEAISNTTLEIDTKFGEVLASGDGLFYITKIIKKDTNIFAVDIERRSDAGIWKLQWIVHFLTKDSFWIESNDSVYKGDFDFNNPQSPWYRFSGPQKAQINDTRVRLRVEPNLQAETLAYLNKPERVIILEKSTDKQQVGDMNDYWYKVQLSDGKEGWMYGAFLDME